MKNTRNNKNMNSHLAFGKLIFQLLDKEKNGLVAKLDLLKEMDLDKFKNFIKHNHKLLCTKLLYSLV